jgi:hypothetical protein
MRSKPSISRIRDYVLLAVSLAALLLSGVLTMGCLGPPAVSYTVADAKDKDPDSGVFLRQEAGHAVVNLPTTYKRGDGKQFPITWKQDTTRFEEKVLGIAWTTDSQVKLTKDPAGSAGKKCTVATFRGYYEDEKGAKQAIQCPMTITFK